MGAITALAMVAAGWMTGPRGMQPDQITWVRYDSGYPTGARQPAVRFAAQPGDQVIIDRVRGLLALAQAAVLSPHLTPREHDPALTVAYGTRAATYRPAWTCVGVGNCQRSTSYVLRSAAGRTLPLYAPALAGYLTGTAQQDYPLTAVIDASARTTLGDASFSVQGSGFTCSRGVLWLAGKYAPFTAASDPQVPPTPSAIRLTDLWPHAGQWEWEGQLLVSPATYVLVAKGVGSPDGQPCSAELVVEVTAP